MQSKSEEWDGLFIDIGTSDVIANQSVIQADIQCVCVCVRACACMSVLESEFCVCVCVCVCVCMGFSILCR